MAATGEVCSMCGGSGLIRRPLYHLAGHIMDWELVACACRSPRNGNRGKGVGRIERPTDEQKRRIVEAYCRLQEERGGKKLLAGDLQALAERWEISTAQVLALVREDRRRAK